MRLHISRRAGVARTSGSVEKTGPAASRDRTAGQAFVEFALGMPLMLLIMLGTLDVGQVFIDYVQLRNGCREAASFGARNPKNTPAIENRVMEHAPMLSDGGTTVTVQFSPSGSQYLTVSNRTTVQIIITCSRTFQPITTDFLGRFGIQDFQLDAVSTAQVLK